MLVRKKSAFNRTVSEAKALALPPSCLCVFSFLSALASPLRWPCEKGTKVCGRGRIKEEERWGGGSLLNETKDDDEEHVALL